MELIKRKKIHVRRYQNNFIITEVEANGEK